MCLKPLPATVNKTVAKYSSENGLYTKGISYTIGRAEFTPHGELMLPCGKCSECKSLRAIEWATRAKHEISQHNENCFLTLTYNDDNLPSHEDIRKPFQKFMKRLRHLTKNKIRCMVSHEYGSKTFRPHHHAIIFGWNPEGQYEPKTTKSGEKIFRSSQLEKLWTHGHSSVGTATERSAYYIASYSLKGSTHDISLPNGEIITVTDRFDASRRPAIGLNYLRQNSQQLLDSNSPMPRYYLKSLKKENPFIHEQFENKRQLQLKTRSSQELLAKFTLDHQKSNPQNEYRYRDDDSKEHAHYKKYYKTNRDEYHRLTKEK